jgi:hypothetical protein
MKETRWSPFGASGIFISHRPCHQKIFFLYNFNCSVGTFAFGLTSGVIGVYSNGERVWRVKTKSQVI